MSHTASSAPGSLPSAVAVASDSASPGTPTSNTGGLVWHITRKDLRALWLPIAIWLVLTVLHAVLRGVGSGLIATETGRGMAIQPLIEIIPVMRGLLFVLIVALLVHGEPLVSTDAFWLTRPMPRRVLFASKLLSAAIVLIVPSLIVELVLMAGFGVPAADLARVTPDLLLGSVTGLALALVAAALTPNLTHLLLWTVSIMAAGWTTLLVVIHFALGDPDVEPALPVPYDPTSGVVGSLVLIAGLAFAAWSQYRTRRRGRAALLAVGAIAGSFVASSVWPDVSFYGEPQIQEAWARDPDTTRLRVARDVRHVTDILSFMERATFRQIAAPVVLDGVPAGFAAQPFTAGATVTTTSGAVLQSQRAGTAAIDVARGTEISGLGAPEAERHSRTPGTLVEHWPVLVRARVAAIEGLGASTGTYAGTFQYAFTRKELLGTQPLLPEAQFTDGPFSLRLQALTDRRDVCDVAVRATGLRPRASRMTNRSLLYVFRDRVTGQQLKHQFRSGRSTMRFESGGFFPSFSRGNDDWFDVRAEALEIMAPAPEGQAGGVRPIACDRIDVEFVRQTYAGRLQRTLTLPAFHLEPQPGDLKGDQTH